MREEGGIIIHHARTLIFERYVWRLEILGAQKVAKNRNMQGKTRETRIFVQEELLTKIISLTYHRALVDIC